MEAQIQIMSNVNPIANYVILPLFCHFQLLKAEKYLVFILCNICF